MSLDRDFLGRGWAFPPELSTHDNPTRMVRDDEDVRQSLIILLSTRVGERVYRPDYGTDLHLYPFEQIDLSVETDMKQTIRKAILLFEPRVSLNKVVINQSMIDKGILTLEIYYAIRASGKEEELFFPFHLDAM